MAKRNEREDAPQPGAGLRPSEREHLRPSWMRVIVLNDGLDHFRRKLWGYGRDAADWPAWCVLDVFHDSLGGHSIALASIHKLDFNQAVARDTFLCFFQRPNITPLSPSAMYANAGSSGTLETLGAPAV